MITKQKMLAVIIFELSLVYTNLTFAQQTPWPTTDTISPSTSPPPTTKQPTSTPPKEKDEENIQYNKFGLGLFYNFANTSKIKLSASESGESGSGDLELKSDGAMGLLFYGDSRFNNSWGMEYGVGYEFQRTIKSLKFFNTEETTKDPKPTMTLSYFQINGKFFPGVNFYILFGFNLNFIKFENSIIDLDMGYGGQIGLGYQISKNFALEAQYQMFYAKYDKSVTVDTATATADGFSLEGVKILLRYSF